MSSRKPHSKLLPSLSLSKVRVFHPMSRETYCFNAILVWNGVPFATVENDGQGGPDMVCHLPGGRETLSKVKFWVEAETYVFMDEEFEYSLEIVVSDLLEAHLDLVALRRLLAKSWVYTKAGRQGIWKVSPKTPEQRKVLKEQDWSVGHILNDLPEAEAMQVYRDNVRSN